MTFNWKKSAIVLIDLVLGGYLVLAITAFNRPDELSNVCGEVKINIKDGVVRGFLNADEVKLQLQRANLYPLGEQMDHVDARRIEETLRQNPFVKTAECYKTQTGRVHITLTQRLPVIRVKADSGEDYYVDEHGNIMPNTRFVSDLAVATGHIQKRYAQKVLTRIGKYLLEHPLWRSQVEQLNVLTDGTVEAVPRVGDHVIYLGKPVDLDRKFARLEKFYKYGLSEAGWNKYSYISIEFANQIICKKRR
jgi:cell division protein FtsQ